MRFQIVAAGALAALLSAAVCDGGVRWFKSYEDCHKAAQQTGRPMAIGFVTGGQQRVRAYKKMFDKRELARYQRIFLFVCVPVEIVNNTINNPLLAKYKPGARFRPPLTFFADSTEKTLHMLQGDKKSSDLAFGMRLALRKHGPVANPKKLREALAKLKQADAFYEAGNYGPAAGLYRKVVGMGFKAPPVAAAKGKLAKIEEMANEQLQDALADVEDKAYPDAVDKLTKLERQFASLEAGQKAHEQLGKLRKLPEAKEAFAAAKAAKADEPAADEPKGVSVDEAESRIDGFTDEELDALDAMAGGDQASPAAARTPGAGKKCRRLLGLARNWIANKRPDKAKAMLRRVIDDYPDTLYADRAKAMLKEID